MILNKQLALKDNTINVISDIQGYAWLKAKGFETLTSKVNGGETPMYVACQSGNLEVCQWLFEVGAKADISTADNDGWTPVHTACKSGNLELCQWLFDNGAKEDISKTENIDGKTNKNEGITYMLERGILVPLRWTR